MHDTLIKVNGHVDDVPSDQAVASLAPQNYDRDIQPVGLFLIKYRDFPCILDCETDADDIRFHPATILDYLEKEYQHDRKKDTILRRYHRRVKQNYVYSRLIRLMDGVMIHLSDCTLESDIQNPNKLTADFPNGYFLSTETIKIFHLPEHEQLAQDLSVHFGKMTVFTSLNCTLQMVCRNKCGFYLSPIKIKKPLITELGLHYGQKFLPIHEKILTNLNQKEGKGIVLLHGVPGSGKTHYIRYLIQEIKDKTLIYIPPDMAKEISSPAFLPFLMESPNAILIIEDAENIIKDRNDTLVPSQAVANLLNLSDGLLGDAMHQQILATFNCDLSNVDPALLRKGRLIANYEFNQLDVESSKMLSEKLGFPTDQINSPMTLAEIYNQNEQAALSD